MCDLARIRTWNLLIRSQTRYPLRHKTMSFFCQSDGLAPTKLRSRAFMGSLPWLHRSACLPACLPACLQVGPPVLHGLRFILLWTGLCFSHYLPLSVRERERSRYSTAGSRMVC